MEIISVSPCLAEEAAKKKLKYFQSKTFKRGLEKSGGTSGEPSDEAN